MRWLFVYLAVGALSTAVLLAKQARERGNPFITADYQGAARFLLPILALLAAVVGWPAVIWLGIKSAMPRAESTGADGWEFGEFTVRPYHLTSRASIEAIEAQELVVDPLGAAPQLPFGFLNDRWRALLQTREPGDELWTFEAPYMRTTRLGYALVRSGVITGFFRSGCRPDEQGPPGWSRKRSQIDRREPLGE